MLIGSKGFYPQSYLLSIVRLYTKFTNQQGLKLLLKSQKGAVLKLKVCDELLKWKQEKNNSTAMMREGARCMSIAAS